MIKISYIQSKKEILKHFKEQCNFLESSCKAYDEGNISEGKRLATSLRVLLHDTSNSISLLQHLDMKDINFYDTTIKFPIGAFVPAFHPLLLVGVKMGKFIPRLDRMPPTTKIKRISFEKWWNMPILRNVQGTYLTRKDVVTYVANKDGGAHIDKKLPEKYADISRKNTLGWSHRSSGQDTKDIMGAELASVRQITHEVLKTLKEEYNELVLSNNS